MELEATTQDPGTTLRAPTADAGFAPACKDTCFANLRLQLREKHYNGTEGKVKFSRWPLTTSEFASLCLDR